MHKGLTQMTKRTQTAAVAAVAAIAAADLKTFSIAGTSVFNGTSTFRFANGKMNIRVNMLKHGGHTDISLVELPKPMTKIDATAYLITRGYQGVIPTRSANKDKPNAILEAAQKKADSKLKAAATRAAKKVPVVAEAKPARKSRKVSEVAAA